MSDQTKKTGVLSVFMHRNPWLLALSFVFTAALVIGYCAHFKVIRPVINDEALELIQGGGMPLDKFYFFTPDTAYPEGNADIIESLYPYVVRLMVHAGDVSPIKIIYCTVYVVSCVLFAWAAGRLWGVGWAAGAGLSLASSSFALVINTILTRNGISILWSCLIVVILVVWTRRGAAQSLIIDYAQAVLLAVILILGCWTYTAFRLVAVAVYVALVVDWWCHDKTKNGVLRVMVSGVFFASVLAALMAWNSISLLMILQRGGYAVGDGSGYLARLAWTLVTPFCHPSNQWTAFIVEDVHILVGGAVLSKWLAGFFVVGWLASLIRDCRVARMAAVIWTTGMILCAVAGPNFKYLLPFLPFTLLLAIYGVKICLDQLVATVRRERVLGVCAGLVFVGAASGGLNDFFTRFPSDQQHEGNRISNAMADEAINRVRGGADLVYVQPGKGVDIVYWRLKTLISSGRVVVYSTTSRLMEGLAQQVSVPANTVLLIDYPIDQFKNSIQQGNTLPDLEIINVRELPGF